MKRNKRQIFQIKLSMVEKKEHQKFIELSTFLKAQLATNMGKRDPALVAQVRVTSARTPQSNGPESGWGPRGHGQSGDRGKKEQKKEQRKERRKEQRQASKKGGRKQVREGGREENESDQQTKVKNLSRSSPAKNLLCDL